MTPYTQHYYCCGYYIRTFLRDAGAVFFSFFFFKLLVSRAPFAHNAAQSKDINGVFLIKTNIPVES